jgi:predicted ATPase/class 3 adenylate cyclase
VQFIDLVGATTLSQQLDPEDYHGRVVAYQTACRHAIARYDGHIAQYLGDGVLVYFGYPTAHEEDAVRAVRSGLEIVTAVSQLTYTPPLQVRIGIHTGPVVVGEIGAGERTERLALGETPNIAARVQSLAEPDTVVLSAATHHLVRGLFECHDLGPQALKGISIPLSVYQVREVSSTQSRFEAAVRRGLTPLVGREEELGLLQRRWEQAKTGTGQVVLLSGEPGIGKSRLMQTLKEHVISEGTAHIEFRCSPYHQNSAFYPIVEHLQRLLQFEREDSSQAKLTKLRQALVAYRFPLADTLSLLATLLSLPQPEGIPPLTLTPQKQKQKTQEVLVAWIVAEAEKASVYCAWEDLHWIDPSSLEVLTLVLNQVPTTRLLALLTFRPEFTSPWGNRSHFSQMTLSRLGHSQVEMMVERVSGGKALPPEVVRQIAVKSDGVPLFVEELTKNVIEAGETTDQSPLRFAIPATLQDSLMARLDRLGPAKEIAQLGATIGREFSYELLQAASPLEEATLQHGLKQLVEAELVYQRGLWPRANYLFKHALIQDTAYQSLLKSTRQQSHRQIAQVLVERFPETVETQPELVAHHYTEAGLTEQAIPYWQQAGDRATQRSANLEAISHLTKGLELLKTVPDTLERAQQELALQIALGMPLMLTRGHAALEVEAPYIRARELCRQIGETPYLFPVLLGLRRFYFMRGELQTARDLGEQLLTLAQNLQDAGLLARAHMMEGEALYYLGEFVQARDHLDQGAALYDPQQHRSHAFLYGSDSGVGCLFLGALVLETLGYPTQALKRSYEAFTLAQELSHSFSLAFALYWASRLCQRRGEGRAAQERAETLVALANEQEFALWEAWGTVLWGWALAEQGQGAEGITRIRQGLAAEQAAGAELNQPYFLALLAEAYEKGGQAEEGLAVLAKALAVVEKTGVRHYEAELYRLKGELTLVQSNVQSLESRVKEAEECFWKAIEIGRKQQAKSLELRAATSLARLWQQQGKQKEAHAMLAEIYHWFTEGFDTKDLQEAKALLEELH